MYNKGKQSCFPFFLDKGEYMAIIDGMLVTKTSTGEAVRVGDTGKTVVRDLPPDASIDNIEPYFFYAKEHTGIDPNTLSEITNIQVEPEWTENVSQLDKGDAMIYNADDLLD